MEKFKEKDFELFLAGFKKPYHLSFIGVKISEDERKRLEEKLKQYKLETKKEKENGK